MGVCLLDADKAEQWRGRLNGDGEFKQVARDIHLNLALDIGGERRLLKFRDGKLAAIVRFVALTEPVDVTIKGTAEFWEKLLLPVPPPRFQNVYAGVRFGTCEIGGNAELYFAYYAAIIRMIEALQEFQNGRG